jgi:flagellar biosynthesis/type III secretory pathway protein FliH
MNRHKLKSVAMPLLGSTHGKITEQVFIKLLQESLINRNPAYPGKIVLMVAPDKLDYIKAVINDYGN